MPTTGSSAWSSRRWRWTAAPPRRRAAGRRRVKARWTAGRWASNARWRWTLRASRWAWSRPRPEQPRLPAVGPYPGYGVRDARRVARRDERPPRPRLRLGGHPTAAHGSRLAVGDLGEGQAGAVLGHEEVGGGEDSLVAQRPQEAGVVHREDGAGHRFLGGVLGGGDHREEADPRGLDALPLGGAASTPTV